jgi:hypothetical protein
MGKKPRGGFQVRQPEKVPRGGEAANVSTKPFSWRLSEIDFDGPFGWDKADVRQVMAEIIPKLHDYESMTWGAMDGPSGSHSVEVQKLCKEAQDRLAALGKDEQGELFSVRITGERRVWGVKDIAILRVIWWDPDHAICPSMLKHT